MSFGSKEQEVVLNKGVNIVLGKDLNKNKSNGAGKSSFLETIPFALFGQVQRNIRKDQIINWKNKRNCEVSCKFKIGENEYNIIRSIKPDNFEIYKNNVLINKPSHIREYQQQLDEILGINFQTFISLIHSNINSSQKILAMGKPEKRKFLERVFNVDIYSKIHERATEKLKTFYDKGNLINIKLNQENYSLVESKDRIERLKKEMEKYINSSETLHNAQIEYKKLVEKNPAIKKDFETATEWTIVCEKKVGQIEKLMEKIINEQIKQIRFEKMTPILKDLEYIEKEKENNNEIIEWQEKLKTFEEKHGNIIDIKKDEDIGKKKIKILYDAEKSLNNSLNKKKIEIAENKIEIKSSKKIVITFKSGMCPTCGQSIKDEQKIIKIQTKYRSLVINNEKLQEEYEKIKDELWNVEDEKKVKETEQTRIEDIKEKYYKLKENATTTIKIVDESKKEDLIIKKELLKKEIYKLEANVIKLEEKLNSWNERLINAVEEEGKIYRIKEEIVESKKILNQIEVQVETEDSSKRSIEKLIKTEQITIKKVKSSMEKEEKERIKLSSIIDYLEYIKEICKDENIKQYAISFLMPYLNQQINHYLSKVDYGFFTVLDNWLEAEIKGPNIVKGTYGSLSGGEGRGIDLSLQFALLDITRIRANRWPDLLVMDEILDSSVDREGIKRLFEIIKVKQFEDESKIYIISHREEIGDDFVSDNIINIVKEDGYSRVE